MRDILILFTVGGLSRLLGHFREWEAALLGLMRRGHVQDKPYEASMRPEHVPPTSPAHSAWEK